MANTPVVNTEIRPLTPDDADAHQRLMSQAFDRGRVVGPPAEGDPPPDMANKYGVFQDGRLQADLTITPFNLHWHGETTTRAMGGIAGVATWAEARGQGHVGQLLRHSLEVMRESGQTVSALYPFAWGFYRKYGWEWVGRKQRMKLPLTKLTAAPEGREVICVSGSVDEVKSRLAAACATFGGAYRGVFDTTTRRWDDALAHSGDFTTYVYIYEPTGEYFLWRYDRDSKGTIREWVAWTPEGHRALLSLLHYLSTQCDFAKVVVPDDSPLWSQVMHWDLETETSPVFMGRVVDVAAAFTLLRPVADVRGAVAVAVSDPDAPWNNGTFRIEAEGGGVTCTPVSGEAGVTLDIQALSQAFWGTPSLQFLRRAGRIGAVGDEAGFVFLDTLLPPTPVFTLDHF